MPKVRKRVSLSKASSRQKDNNTENNNTEYYNIRLNMEVDTEKYFLSDTEMIKGNSHIHLGKVMKNNRNYSGNVGIITVLQISGRKHYKLSIQ